MTPVVRALLIANVLVFFLQQTLPGLENSLAFYPAFVLARPWTILTYMFAHGGFTHILFNMLALYFFGPRVEERIGSQSFTWLYFISGISGALVSFFLSPSPIVGASAGVFGVMLAFAHFWPDAPILIWGIIPVPARILVIITTLISLFSGFSGAGAGVAHFAHLGGYAGAFAYIRWLDRARTTFKRKATAPSVADTRRVADYKAIDRTKIHEINRQEVDRILDKISAQGVGSLTPQEQLFLSNFVPLDDRMPPKS